MKKLKPRVRWGQKVTDHLVGQPESRFGVSVLFWKGPGQFIEGRSNIVEWLYRFDKSLNPVDHPSQALRRQATHLLDQFGAVNGEECETLTTQGLGRFASAASRRTLPGDLARLRLEVIPHGCLYPGAEPTGSPKSSQ